MDGVALSLYERERADYYEPIGYKELLGICDTTVAQTDGRRFATACKGYKKYSARWLRRMLTYFDVQDKFGFYHPTEI